MRPSRRASVATQNGSDKAKAGSAQGSNKEAAASGSKHGSKKEDSKPNSKPTSEKVASNDKVADTPKAAEGPQKGAQNPSTPSFTAEEDARLLLLKNEDKPWAEIAAAINKSKKQTRQRFHEIKKGGIDKAGVSEDKDDKNDKQVAKMGKKEVEEGKKNDERSKSKPNAIDKNKKEQALSAALLVAGEVKHAHAHRHEVHHHIHSQDTQPSRPKDSQPRRYAKETSRARDTKPTSRPKPSHVPPPPPSAHSSRTAYTLATTPSLTEDDLFSFGELQALSELIGKDMQGMWQRVSAAFFGMTGRRIAAEDIRDKFEGLSGQ